VADTRPSRCNGVAVCRSEIVLITHRMGPTPIRKKPSAASRNKGAQMVRTITSAATSPATGPIATTTPARVLGGRLSPLRLYPLLCALV
jgi:hypothetical protein